MGVFFILEPVRLLGACKPGLRAFLDSTTVIIIIINIVVIIISITILIILIVIIAAIVLITGYKGLYSVEIENKS